MSLLPIEELYGHYYANHTSITPRDQKNAVRKYLSAVRKQDTLKTQLEDTTRSFNKEGLKLYRKYNGPFVVNHCLYGKTRSGHIRAYLNHSADFDIPEGCTVKFRDAAKRKLQLEKRLEQATQRVEDAAKGVIRTHGPYRVEIGDKVYQPWYPGKRPESIFLKEVSA